MTKNQVFEQKLEESDLKAAWYSVHEYQTLKQNLFGTIHAYQQQQKQDICMQGLEHHSSSELNREKYQSV
jgi:hypothetical protein